MSWGTKKIFLGQKSCLGTKSMITVAWGAREKHHEQLVYIYIYKKRLNQIDRCRKTYKCPVGADLKEVFDRMHFGTWIFFCNLAHGNMKIFVGRIKSFCWRGRDKTWINRIWNYLGVTNCKGNKVEKQYVKQWIR